MSPPLVVLALADSDAPDEQRKALATALVSSERPDHFSPTRVEVPGPDFTDNDECWPEDGSLPSLATLVGSGSWLLFHVLEMDGEKLNWLSTEVA